MTKITSSINSLVRLWKISHARSPGCSFYELYEWYIINICITTTTTTIKMPAKEESGIVTNLDLYINYY